jgi:transporter family-2 protein
MSLLPMILMALLAGVAVSLSRSVNGRLSLATTPLVSSFWNHIVGAAALTLVALLSVGVIPASAATAPWHAWIGGPIGVVFIALGSWLVARIGAALTAMLVIAGQMISGVALDLLRGTSGNLALTLAGVALILAGMALAQRRRG